MSGIMLIALLLVVIFGKPIRRGLVDWGVALGQKGIFALMICVPIALFLYYALNS